MLTLFASNVICTRISPLTGSFSNGRSLWQTRRAWAIRASAEQRMAAVGTRYGQLVSRCKRGHRAGRDSLVPLVDGMIVHECWLDLYST